MRTKTLLLAAVLGAASVASSMAQVYSVNAVGYVNVTIAGSGTLGLVANPLQASNNTIASVLAGVPIGTQFYKYDPTVGLISAILDEFDGWVTGTTPSGTLSFNPGEGAFIRNNAAAALTITFVGDVLQGSQTVNLPVGLSLVGSKIPQSGGISSTLGFPLSIGTQVYLYHATPSSGYDSYIYDEFDGWVKTGVAGTTEPQLTVAQGFWVRNNGTAALAWARTFSVNTP